MATPDRLNATLKFHCSEHPTRYIEGVDLTASETKQVYCLVCLLQNPDAHNLYLSLQTFPTFLENCAASFAEEKAKAMTVPNPPREYLQLLASKDHNISRLKMRLNDQKKKFEASTEELKNLLLQAIERRKTHFFNELDDHLNSYIGKYQDLERVLCMCYPSAEDLDVLFPSREVLESDFRRTRSTTDIEAFVKRTKVQLEENKKKVSLSLLDDESKLSHLEPVKLELFTIENTNKDFQHEIENIRNEIKNSAEQHSDLLSPASGIQVEGLFPSGDINLTPEDFSLIKEWLPDQYSSNFDPKLLYKGITDGMTPQAFHTRCDGQGPTLTIIKGMFLGSSEMSVLGGFLDKDWQSKNTWIPSDQAFIFSLSGKVKCPVSVTSRAAYGGANRGPAFGYGHDLMVAEILSKSYMNPQSYTGAAQMVKSSAYNGSGTIHFTPYDIEVYSLSL